MTPNPAIPMTLPESMSATASAVLAATLSIACLLGRPASSIRSSGSDAAPSRQDRIFAAYPIGDPVLPSEAQYREDR
jgi:hypothetical protein